MQSDSGPSKCGNLMHSTIAVVTVTLYYLNYHFIFTFNAIKEQSIDNNCFKTTFIFVDRAEALI